jgi:hypothetical protein
MIYDQKVGHNHGQAASIIARSKSDGEQKPEGSSSTYGTIPYADPPTRVALHRGALSPTGLHTAPPKHMADPGYVSVITERVDFMITHALMSKLAECAPAPFPHGTYLGTPPAGSGIPGHLTSFRRQDDPLVRPR